MVPLWGGQGRPGEQLRDVGVAQCSHCCGGSWWQGKDRTGVGAIGASAFCSPLPRGSLWRLTTNMHTNSVHKPCCSNSSLKNWFPHLPLIYKPQLPLIPAAKTYKLPHNFLNTMPYFILKWNLEVKINWDEYWIKDNTLIELPIFIYLFFKGPIKNASINGKISGSGTELRPSTTLGLSNCPLSLPSFNFFLKVNITDLFFQSKS